MTLTAARCNRRVTNKARTALYVLRRTHGFKPLEAHAWMLQVLRLAVGTQVEHLTTQQCQQLIKLCAKYKREAA